MRNLVAISADRLSTTLRTPRAARRGALLLALLGLWCVVGVSAFSTPVIDGTSQYDLAVIHAGGRYALAGGDVYSALWALSYESYQYALQREAMTNATDARHTSVDNPSLLIREFTSLGISWGRNDDSHIRKRDDHAI
jgi:hypothetical protein